MAFHGDEGHSCYNEDGKLTCAIAKMMQVDGPDWRRLAKANAPSDTSDTPL